LSFGFKLSLSQFVQRVEPTSGYGSKARNFKDSSVKTETTVLTSVNMKVV